MESSQHGGRQHFITLLMLLLSKEINKYAAIILNLLQFIQPGTISVRGTVLYRASSLNQCSCLFVCVVVRMLFFRTRIFIYDITYELCTL